jgi:hypothetical protein
MSEMTREEKLEAALKWALKNGVNYFISQGEPEFSDAGLNDVPLNCPACSMPLDEFVCPHCEDGQDEDGNQCVECCGTSWLHIRQAVEVVCSQSQ